jgi:CNT family concentrative nucleoside transporter
MDRYNLISFMGVFVLLGVGWLLSADRGRMNWRCVATGVGIQLFLGFLVFQAPGSRGFFLWLNRVVLKLLEAASAGQEFLFGPLAIPAGEEKSLGFILAIQGLPLIIFFAALMGLLYYWRVMPLIIRGFAWFFSRVMRISGAESLCASSNIFVGIESATAVRPYLARMTRSEFCVILTAGMATVASSVLGVYVSFLSDVFPEIAGHLISASIMSAPAAIVMAKILVPETEEPATMGQAATLDYERESGAIESVITGAMAGVKLVVGVCALLIAFLGLAALLNLLVGYAGDQISGWFGRDWDWSIERGLGYIFSPLAYVMGVPPEDVLKVGEMLGDRLVKTELPTYQRLSEMISAGEFTHTRSVVVSSYALCGFAHIASLAIFVGGISSLVPERRRDIASVSWRALLAATLACLMTGAVAGVFYHSGAVVLQKG